MTIEKRQKFTVITNNIDIGKRETVPKKAEKISPPRDDGGYHTNPMYEKLLQFKEEQKRKRFTVEDLLKW